METQTVRVDDENCNGKCKHAKHYHVVKFEGKTACAKVDCACMDYVPAPKLPEA